MTIEDLTKKLGEDLIFWQQHLRLRDWEILLSITRQMDNHGECRKVSDYKDAEIKILHPDAVRDSWLGNKDPEVTLVHELLHLQGEALDDFLIQHEGGRWKNDQERWMELTAIALVNVRRMGGTTK